MSSHIFKLAQGGTKYSHKYKNIDALQIKKYIGCFIYKIRTLPLEEMVKRANTPIEYLFNCHAWCNLEWCWANQLSAKEQELATRMMIHNTTLDESNVNDNSVYSD